MKLKGGARKRDRGAATRCRKGPSRMKVTNQGGFGTCAVHAFAKCLAQGMLQKYDIAVDPNALIQQVISLVACCRGTTFDQLCNEWNRKIAEKNEGAGIADMDNAVRYWISVDTTTVGTIDQAWQLAPQLQQQPHQAAV